MTEPIHQFDPNIIDEIREKYAQGAVLTLEDIENLFTGIDYWRHGAESEHALTVKLINDLKEAEKCTKENTKS